MSDFKKNDKRVTGSRKKRRDDRRSSTKIHEDLKEKVVYINRCAKVVKGGRRFGFSALVLVGDQKGRIGVGCGKTKEVPEAIKVGTSVLEKICCHLILVARRFLIWRLEFFIQILATPVQ